MGKAKSGQGPDVGQPTQTKQDGTAQDNSQDKSFDLPFSVNDVKDDMTPDALRSIHKDWQKAFTPKRMAETAELKALRENMSQMESAAQINQQKADTYDALTKDPAFMEFAKGRSTQRSDQSIEMDLSGLEEHFEEPAGIKKLVEVLGANTKAQLDQFKEELGPVFNMVNQSRATVEFDNLVRLAKERNWEDPNLYRREIDFAAQKFPGISMIDAFDFARGMKLRSAGNLQPVGQNMDNQPLDASSAPVVSQASGNAPAPLRPGGTTVTDNPMSNKSVFEQTVEESSGDRKNVVRRTFDTVWDQVTSSIGKQ